MNDYMLIYKGGDPAWMENTTPEDMAASMQQWEAWMGALAEKEQLVSGGSPLEYSGQRVTKDGVITDIAASEFKELVSGYSIIKASSAQEAAEIAKGCPIFNYPEIVVEVRQIANIG